MLVELADRDERRRLDAALRRTPVPGALEHVPADHTVLVRVASAADLQRVVDGLRALELPRTTPLLEADGELVVPVRYDGPDLGVVADHLGISPADVVARHTHARWRVEFAGFAPGFGYLTPLDDPDLVVPRRDEPRTRIPAGAVALAGPYSGVYPSASPGGWQIIGTTELALWDATREPPALMTPGRSVRFEEVR